MKKLLITTFAALLLCCGALKISLVAKTATETPVEPQKAAQNESPQEELSVAATDSTVPSLDPKWVTIQGKAVFPDGTPAKRCHYQITDCCSSSTTGNALTTDEQGHFTIRTFPSEKYRLALLDPKGEWATPVQAFAWKKDKEIVFEFEKGVKIEGTVRDETTGQPIPGMSMTLFNLNENTKRDAIVFHDQDCDDNGHFSFRVVPQKEYFVTIGLNSRFVHSPDNQRDNDPYGKKVTFDGGNDVTVDFSIPSPFVGRVLRMDGSPAPNLMVQIINYQPSLDNHSHFVTTDREGRFRTTKRPKNVVVTMLVPLSMRGAYIHWFDDDLPADGEAVFQLQPAGRIKGRLIDATSGEPMAKQLVFSGYSDKDNPERKEFLPISATTNLRGEFIFDRIPAGVRYHLFVVPGRQESYGGGPYEPCVEVATLVPDHDGETVDLGDIKLDLTKVKEKR
ncbi:MAG: carboxypeptidase-like regulatory domain-containing protein [Planctomycetaceae bacterium]|nr:carboxypeptidase-like regulatory domain-containing protein [Planctomycetaceae bacterium]